jgi:adenylosuccinate synthase
MQLIVVGCQSGDEGKGKFTDFFSENAYAVVRYQGGPHTGHTVVTEEGVQRFVQLPSGITRGSIGVLGNGCVVDPGKLIAEAEELGVELSPERLLISEIAHVVMPYHLLQDELMEGWRGDTVATHAHSGFSVGRGQLGSTKQGVGPCREDKIARFGLRLVDLLDRDLLEERLSRIVPLKRALCEKVHGADREPLDPVFDLERMIEEHYDYGQQLAPCLGDVPSFMAEARREVRYVVFEGAQSLALDVEHGTYPYCSSGYSAAGGVTVGTGSPPSADFTVVGVSKAYMAQVGGGPLPTELDGETADHLVTRGREVGTVTGRRRRVGWLDLSFVRRALEIDGIEHLCLTNIDALAGLPEVKVATHYEVDGEPYYRYPSSLGVAARVEPVYETLEGWPDQDWDEVARGGLEALSDPARRYVEFVAGELQVSLAAVSVGRRRDQTIMLEGPLGVPAPAL